MDRPAVIVSMRVLMLQALAHALIHAAQNAGNLTERALVASDTAAPVPVAARTDPPAAPRHGRRPNARGWLTAPRVAWMGEESSQRSNVR
jgi:hypothetical protein